MNSSLSPETALTTSNLKQSIKAGLNKKQMLISSAYELKGVVQIQNANNVHLGNSFTLSNDRGHQDPKPEDMVFELTPQIEALLHSKQELNQIQKQMVANQVGSDWRFLGKELANLSNPQMDQLEAPFLANHQPFNEVIYQMLLLWEEQCPEIPTVGMLAKALQKCKMHDALLSLLKAV